MSKLILLNSKMITPSIVSASIPRKRLMEVLDTGKSNKVTIVRAPTGYGKTILLSQWIARHNLRTAWVSLESSDNDSIRFLQYVSKALGKAMKTDLYEQLTPLFNMQPRISIDLLIDLISREIRDYSSEIQLVLDDYHLITHTMIHRAVVRLIDNSPDNFRLLIASRIELPLPLLRWQKNAELQEINVEDIKFTYKETVDYLKGRPMPTYDLNTLHEIYKKTEGWATGIKLTAIALEKNLQKQSTDNESYSEYTYGYKHLFQQLLETLSTEETQFFLQVSVLDYLEPELCNELTGYENSKDILNSFEEKGLFVNRLTENKYSYHHIYRDLFIQELRLRNSSSELHELFSSGARILYERDEFVRAIELAMRGDVYELAMEWIEKHSVALLSLGQTETLVRWLDDLVKSGIQLSLDLSILHIFTLAMLNDFGLALQIIEQLKIRNKLDQWMTHEDYETEAADFIAIKSYVVLFGLNDFQFSMRLMLERIEQQPINSKFDVIPIRHNAFNPILLQTKIGQNGKLLPEETLMNYFKGLRKTNYKKLLITGYSYGVLAETLVERNKIDDAQSSIEEAIGIGHQFQDTGLVVPMYILRCEIEISHENFKEAHAWIKHAESYVLKLEEHYWMESIHAMKAKVHLSQNEIGEAEEELFKVKNANNYIGGAENEFWWFVHVRILIKRKKFKEGITNIIRMKEVAKEEEKVPALIEALLLQAMIYTMDGDDRQALDALHEALEVGLPQRYLRVYLNEAELFPLIQKYMGLRKTDQINSWNTVPLSFITGIIESISLEKAIKKRIEPQKENPLKQLTRREIEVLKLLTTGLKNREIAAELYLSDGTIRIYLSNIYAKLQVGTRTKAVIIANENEIDKIN